jgi:ribonuclease M5
LIHLDEAVIVEGKYDKIKLASIIDAVIIETGGFSIFSDREQLELIRKLAVSKGVIILTDSDGAGFKIRNFLGGALPKDRVRHVYIPDILGKERRKANPSKEGKLGVEGIPKEIIIKSLERAGVLFRETSMPSHRITKLDLYEDGLTGGFESVSLRRRLLVKLGLPERLSANMLVDVLNAMMSYEEYKEALTGF